MAILNANDPRSRQTLSRLNGSLFDLNKDDQCEALVVLLDAVQAEKEESMLVTLSLKEHHPGLT